MGNFIAKFKDGSTVRVPNLEEWAPALQLRDQGLLFIHGKAENGRDFILNPEELAYFGEEECFEPAVEAPAQEKKEEPEDCAHFQEGPFSWSLPNGTVIKRMHDRIIIEGPIPEDEPERHDCDDCKYEDLHPDVEPCKSCRKVRHQYPRWEPKEVPES